MKLKTCLLGQSLVCLGMIASHAEVATAEVSKPLANSETLTQKPCYTADRFESAQPFSATAQLLSHEAHAAIAPPEKHIGALPHQTAELNTTQPPSSCPSAKALTNSVSKREANKAFTSAPSAPKNLYDRIQPPWMGLASPETTVERSIQPARLSQAPQVSSTDENSTVGEATVLETPPLESVEQLPSAGGNLADDPELGELRLWEPLSEDPELGRLRLWEQPSGDPELGRLRLQEQPLLEDTEGEAEEDSVFLLGRLSVFSSDNILLDAFDPVDDQVFQAGVGLFASPQIGPNTYLFGGIGRSLSVYNHLSGLNYSDLEIQAGIRQAVFANTYVDASWTNQQFFGLDSSGRFFTDNSLRLAISHREQLTDQLFLDGYYQLRFSFTEPSDRSRIFNNLGLSVGYDLAPDLEAGLGYQLILSDFTQEERHDSYHEVTAQLSYDFSENARVTMFGGFSFGDSTESSLNFNSSLFGIIFSTNFSLF